MINKSGVGATQVRALGSNLVSMGGQAKPLGAGMQMATVGGKQTIVINKPQGVAGAGQQIIRTAGGQQIIVMSTAGGMKTVQHVTTSQAGAGENRIIECYVRVMINILALSIQDTVLGCLEDNISHEISDINCKSVHTKENLKEEGTFFDITTS